MIIKTDENQIQSYLTDAANYKGFCEAVYFPENESELVEIVKQANADKKRITVAGNGTGLTGARVPEGGIVIATDKLNNVIEINTTEKSAVVQPAVLMSEFKNLVNEKKLFYPPDPTEQNCYIGATVATNASGAKTFKYGPTRNFVTGLNVILPDGEKIILERGRHFAKGLDISLESESGKIIKCKLPDYEMPETKHTAGYYCKKDMDVIDLFIGSEGTLGIITQITLKLLPKPEEIISAVVFFPDENDALNFIAESRELSYQSRKHNDGNNINAMGLEFFDKNSLVFLKPDFPNIPEASAAVWFEQDCLKENKNTILEKWINLLLKHNADPDKSWIAESETDKKNFHQFRHAISSKVNEYITQNNFRKIGTDTAVPDEEFTGFYFYAKRLVEENKIDFVIYGHFGNSHLHLNMLPKNDFEFETAKKLYGKILQKAVVLKGTISAEHGIGKLKRNYLLEMFGEKNIRKMAQLKKCFDPNLIMGIGNLFEEKFLYL